MCPILGFACNSRFIFSFCAPLSGDTLSLSKYFTCWRVQGTGLYFFLFPLFVRRFFRCRHVHMLSNVIDHVFTFVITKEMLFWLVIRHAIFGVVMYDLVTAIFTFHHFDVMKLLAFRNWCASFAILCRRHRRSYRPPLIAPSPLSS